MVKSTIVELQVISKKEGYQYQHTINPKEFEIELGLDYNPQNVYYKLSGGTNMVLRTINQDAADMFVIGETVVMTISPKVKEVAPELVEA
jgi:predicted transcriptional regulator